jgi:diadenosine tetraphosphate (Ap4A) HIT family hydrolase
MHIADLELSRVFLHEDQFFPGYVLLVLRRHVTELYDLPSAERATLMEEVSRVAQALARVFRPVKMNYELLGNLVPHIHWHLVPRLATDPALRGPIWTVEHQAAPLAPAAARERIEIIRRALA